LLKLQESEFVKSIEIQLFIDVAQGLFCHGGTRKYSFLWCNL
jgi:hypothetical protein